MQELRRHRRLKIPLQVEIRHPSIGTLQVAASDMSDGGVFLLLDDCFQVDIGESVIVRTLGLGAEGEESGPPLVMRVVRRNTEGMGLCLEENASANLKSLTADQTTGHSVLQSLLIINDQQQVLMVKQDQHWVLPSHEMAGSETWQQGVQSLLEKFNTSEPFIKHQDLQVESYCYPNTSHVLPGVNLLIPCRLESTDQHNCQSGQLFAWFSQNQFRELTTTIDPNLVDKIVCQV